MNKTLRKKLEACDDLPTMPDVAMRLIGLLETDAPKRADVIATLESDPAIALKLLRAANSPMNKLVQDVSDLGHAIELLGYPKSMRIALTFTLFEAINGTNYPKPVDVDYFWKRAIIAATVARVMAKEEKGESPDTFFLTALLQDIGVLVLSKTLGEQYARYVSGLQYNHFALVQAELKALFTTHNEVGAWMLDKWHLPKEMTYAIAASHDRSGHYNRMSACVAVSGFLADFWLADENTKFDQETITQGVIQRALGLNYNDTKLLFQTVVVQLPGIARLLNNEHVREIYPKLSAQILNRSKELAKMFDL